MGGQFPEYWLYWTYQQDGFLKTPLRTTNGQAVRIIDSGIRNHDNGPDFLRAILEIAGLRCQGDVEFHRTAEEWFQHGHHEDQRYQNVVLHLLWTHTGSIPAALAERFPHVVLREQLCIPEKEWRAAMQACEEGKTNLAGKSRELRHPSSELLAELAERRFARKVDRLAEWCKHYSFEDVLYIALAETLGYARNQYPFRQLMRQCPPSRAQVEIPFRHRSPLVIWVYWALRASLLEGRFLITPARPGTPILQTARILYQSFADRGFCPLLRLSEWQFSRIRPMNSPFLRLAALSQLFYHYCAPGLFQTLLQTAVQRMPADKTISSWLKLLRIPFDPLLADFLKTLLRFKTTPRHVIGTTRLKQFFLNGLIPLLYLWAERRENRGFQTYLESLYETFPGVEDAGVVERQLQGVEDPFLAQKIRRCAYYQQGMFELYQSPQTPVPTLF